MTKREEKFVEVVWEYYRRQGRRSLPWRRTKNPYRILVSEIMLQQTQVERVLPKYNSFLKKFPWVCVVLGGGFGRSRVRL
jgi:A/G-specific adenine glycosylase